jgi:hypothetical protein
MMRKVIIGSMIVVMATAGVDAKKVDTTVTPATVQALLACRAIADNNQRLACYDRASGPIAQAIQNKDLVMIDRERAQAAKKELFGYSVSGISALLGGGDITQIEGVIAAVGNNPDGGWVIKLADGSVWSQIDDTPMALEPRKGDKVLIKRGTLGSYFVKVSGQPGYKAKRTD